MPFSVPVSPVQWAQFGLSAASDIGSGIGSILQTAETNRHNQWLRQFSEQQAQTQVKQAAINRQFQERMSRNAVSYRAQDLQRAGINPLLAGNNGAQAMSGSTASPVSAPSASFPAAQFSSSAADALESFPYGKNQESQSELNLARAITERFDQMLKDEQIYTEVSRRENIEADTELKGAQTRNVNQDTRVKIANEQLKLAEVDLARKNLIFLTSRIESEELRQRLMNSERAMTDAQFHQILAATAKLEFDLTRAEQLTPLEIEQMESMIRHLNAQSRVVQSAEVRNWLTAISFEARGWLTGVKKGRSF